MRPLLLFNDVIRLGKGESEARQSSFTARMIALQALVTRRGGVVVEVKNEPWHRSRFARLIRPFTLLQTIRRQNPDRVIVQYPNYPFFWSLVNDRSIRRSGLFTNWLRNYCTRRQVKLVLDYRDLQSNRLDDGSRSGVSDAAFSAFEELVVSAADVVWCCSPGLRRLVEQSHPDRRERCRVVPNGGFPGAAAAEEDHEPGRVRCTYSGNLAREGRGVDVMAEAIRSYAGEECTFTLCGPNGEWLEGLFESDPRVEVIGEMPRAEVMQILARSDLGMIPLPRTPYYDVSFPTKLGEYVVSGLAVLATPVRDVADFINANGIGIVAEAEAWPEALSRIGRDEEMRKRCQANSRAISGSMCWDSIYDKAYDELVDAEVVGNA